ncbi:Rv3654c family TadE-like protein [Streptomyces griseorubiginosus]|uniref:Rv3654c family TadE-like protein n=1 Tax=Streptomyces griseorubiginosus TaxID=67304 RepID=UPI0036EC40A8
MRRGPAPTRSAPTAPVVQRVAPVVRRVAPGVRPVAPCAQRAAPCAPWVAFCAQRIASCDQRAAEAPLARWVPRVRRGVARFLGVHLVGARSDRGSATVWSVGAVAVLCVVFGGVLAFGQAVVVRHRAAGAADLAALAAADHWADGPGVACARAEEVARAQGTRLVRCGMVGEISDVTAASGRGPFTAEIRARAGPAVPVLVPVPPGFGGVPGPVQGPRPPAPPAAAP